MEQGYDSRTVKEIYIDFKERRNGIVKALTTEYKDFHKQFDPEKENLCLYGYPSGKWEVKLPEPIPPDLPEPVLGFNFARDKTEEKVWLPLLAAHCDAWLHSISVYHAVRSGLRKSDRRRLFNKINDLTPVSEVVANDLAKRLRKEESSVSNQSSDKLESKSKLVWKHRKERGDTPAKYPKSQTRDDQGETLCGSCGKKYVLDEFWICCDKCEKWYHGKCVKITPAVADRITHYKCPWCSGTKRAPG